MCSKEEKAISFLKTTNASRVGDTMKRNWAWLGVTALIIGSLAGCGGGGGDSSTPPPTVTPPPPSTGTDVGPVTPTAEAVAVASTVFGESCATCHKGASLARTGPGHQQTYDQLYHNGAIKVTAVTFSTNGVDTTTLSFNLKNGTTPVDCQKPNVLPDGFTIGAYYDPYDAANRRFVYPGPSIMSLKGTVTSNATTGDCSFVKTFTSATDKGLIAAMGATGQNADGVVSIYGADGIIETDSAKHMNKAKFPIGGILRLGPVMGQPDAPFLSAATTLGCENCHTQPFNKHAYIPGKVDDATPGSNSATQMFYICKTCHSDARDGGHGFWQLLKEAKDADPATAEGQALRARAVAVDAGGALTAAEEAKYAYKTRLMNDVHMSHAMEFGYPQSMRNCVTCHAGKLGEAVGEIFNIANFQAETCISCHAPNDIMARMRAATYNHAGAADNVTQLRATVCANCHDGSTPAPMFSTIHTGGYDPKIYTAAGVRYSDNVVVSIDSASLAADNKLTATFSATGSAGGLNASSITPTVMIGLYGYDTKDFIENAHGRDAAGNRLLEFKFGDTNPRFTGTVVAPGSWQVVVDLSAWASWITDKTVRRVEIAVLPELKDATGTVVGLNAPSRTFDLGTKAFDDAFYQDIVKVFKENRTLANGYVGVKGCNTCHDQLATTFHSGIRGGNIRVCRLCHVKSAGGSHLELQSRSIDSFAHAIHSFQAFDIDRIDFADAFEAMEYRHHIGSDFPRFGLGNEPTDCESCHVPGKYDVPDQTKSLPALWSGTDPITGATRYIGTRPAYVAGPAATACGGCHRAHMIKADDGGEMTSILAHWKTFGHLNEDQDTLWNAVVYQLFK